MSYRVLQVGPISIGKVAAPSWETRTALLHFHGMSKVEALSACLVSLLGLTIIHLSFDLLGTLQQVVYAFCLISFSQVQLKTPVQVSLRHCE